MLVKFAVGCGEKGSCLSLAIFNVLINAFIIQLKLHNIGCQISNVFLGCIMYADDIILPSLSVVGLQAMLVKCFELASSLSLKFNLRKSHCTVIGKMYNVDQCLFAISL
jgi:hypothetical protein